MVNEKALPDPCMSMIVWAAPAKEATRSSGVPNVRPLLPAPV